ncbi:hypothetical protein GCM10023403_14460 [Pseudonocardia benzenivorans]
MSSMDRLRLWSRLRRVGARARERLENVVQGAALASSYLLECCRGEAGHAERDVTLAAARPDGLRGESCELRNPCAPCGH